MNTSYLKRCDVLLYKGKGFLSRLIQWATKSPYNHVAIAIEPHIRLAIESNTCHQSGVRGLDLKNLDDKEVDVFRVKQGIGFDGDRMISFLISHLGVKFDFTGVIWLGVLKVFSFFTVFQMKPHNKFQKSKDYFCSELCYAAFMAGGLDIVPQVEDADVTSPGDIARSERLGKIAV